MSRVILHHMQPFGSMRMVVCFDCSEALKLHSFFQLRHLFFTAVILVELVPYRTMVTVKREPMTELVGPHGRMSQMSSPDDLPRAVQWMNTNHGGPMQLLRKMMQGQAVACFHVVVVGASLTWDAFMNL